jgi:glycosyltransferase involved in cell wall biosynthesis
LKILYVSQYFPPEMGAPAARVAELSRLWARQGHDVTVLTGFPNHPTGVVPAEYRRRFHHFVSREKLDGVNVVRTWLLPLPNRKAYERMLNYSSFCLSAALTGMFLSRPDVVIATSPQLLVGLSGRWIARRKRVRFILEVRDLWPESLGAVGLGGAGSLLHYGLGQIAGFLYRAADHIVVVTHAFQKHLETAWRVSHEKISVVENGVDSKLFHPGYDGASIRRELGLEGKFVASYIGTMGMAHGLETLIEAAQLLGRTAPQVVFLLVGEGAEKQRIQSLVREYRLTNVLLLDQQPRERVPHYVSASDACLVLLKRSEIFRTVIPTKMLEFMACARPVVLGVEGEAQRLLQAANAGLCIQPENPADLANAILKLARDSHLRQSLGANGRRYILQNFTRQQMASVYLEVLDRVLEKGGAVPALAA